MEDRLPKPSNFSVGEEEWMETLSRLLARDAQRIFWLSLESRPLMLSARQYRLRFDKRKIYLYEPQQTPSPQQQHLGVLALPQPEIGHYYQDSGKDTETWLCLKFRLLRDG